MALLTTQQKESWQLALINLFLMSLCTLLCQVLAAFSESRGWVVILDNPEGIGFPGNWIANFLTVIVFPALWVGPFLWWISYLGAVLESSRNIALLYGIIAVNGGLVYLLTSKQRESATLRSYVYVTLWPMFLGFMLGSFMAVIPDMALSKAWAAYHCCY
jgi:hypothetical protein